MYDIDNINKYLTKENVETNKDIKETNTQNKEEGKDEN